MGEEGEALLARIAAESGGRVDPAAGMFFQGSREGSALRSLTGPLSVVAVLVVLLEILVRRTGFVPRVRKEMLRRWMPWPRRRGAAGAGVAAAATRGATTAAEAAASRAQARGSRGGRAGDGPGDGPDATPRPPVGPHRPESPTSPKPPAGPPSSPHSPTAPGGISSVIDRAKDRRRLGP